MNRRLLPFCATAGEVDAPPGWVILRIEDAYEQLPIGRRYDQKSVTSSGSVPVIDQSADGVIGYHDDEPGVTASFQSPVVTFANHTCAMRLMKRPFSVIQNVFPLVGRAGLCETKFLYYATMGRQQTEEYKGHHPAWRRSFFGLPELTLQRRIVQVLEGLDDSIANNRRRIELLEQMAQEIYREWFVRFRYPGHENDALVDSPLGPIPEGWEMRKIEELCAGLTRGIAPKYADDGPWIVLNQRCIRNGRVTLQQARRQERAVPIVKQVRFGDVLLNSTGVGTLGRVGVVVEEHLGLTADSHVSIVRPLHLGLQPWFGLHMLQRQSEFEAMGAGTTGQTELSVQAVGRLQLVFPTPEVLDRFGQVAWSLVRPVPRLLKECGLLAAMRDLLLPKLVTGQIDVSTLDLDALMESVA